MSQLPMQKTVVKHNSIANRTFTHDANTLIECVPFSNLGKIQPFLVTLSTNAAFLMDFHCHLSKSEVYGYLAGHWDVNTHNLQVTRAFPCKNTKTDRDNASRVESEIWKEIEKGKLTLVGWYHSHPFLPCAPTLRDIDAQLDYQIRMKGISDNSYIPCIGFILSPYNYENAQLEILSNIIAYWIIPPPESKPNEYGRPMLMSYSVVQDAVMTQQVKDEINTILAYYKKDADFIDFMERYNSTSTYIDKLRTALVSKFPRDENEAMLWSYIREILGCPPDPKDNLLSIPSINKTTSMLSGINSSAGLGANLMAPTDIASVLFNSGKFPSATSMLGLPDPMAHTTLAANNMFLSTNLFKMQELLKPLSSSTSIGSSKSKGDKLNSPLKIPTDLKNMKMDFPTDINMLNLKNKFDLSHFDMSGIAQQQKPYFSLADLSIFNSKSSKSDFTLDLSRKDDLGTNISKSDFQSLDLSMPSSRSFSETALPSDLTITNTDEDQPMNLTGD